MSQSNGSTVCRASGEGTTGTNSKAHNEDSRRSEARGRIGSCGAEARSDHAGWAHYATLGSARPCSSNR
jgi:hypothetical protein